MPGLLSVRLGLLCLGDLCRKDVGLLLQLGLGFGLGLCLGDAVCLRGLHFRTFPVGLQLNAVGLGSVGLGTFTVCLLLPLLPQLICPKLLEVLFMLASRLGIGVAEHSGFGGLTSR